MDEKDLIRSLSYGRVVLGVALFLAPRKASRLWTGESPEMAVSHMAVRGQGIRDIGLGLGTLIALENDGPVRGWLEASALADAGDAAATLLAWKRFRGWKKYPLVALEAGAAYVGLQLAHTVDS